MGNVKVVMSPGSARKKKGIGCDIRVERKNKFESLVNGGGRDRDLLLRPLCGKKSDGANHLHYVSILPTGTYGQFRDRPGRYKRRDKKHKDKLPWSLCVDIISSPKFFFGLYRKWKRARDLWPLYLDRYRPPWTCDVPSAEPIAKASGHD